MRSQAERHSVEAEQVVRDIQGARHLELGSTSATLGEPPGRAAGCGY